MKKKKEYLRLDARKGKKAGRRSGKEIERAKRRRRIREKLERKLVESERERKRAEEIEKHGSLKVREIETIEGRERIAPEKAGEEFRPLSKPFDSGEFFIGLALEDVELIEKSHRLGTGQIEKRLRKLIERGGGIALAEAKLRTVEEEVFELMEAYGISEREVMQEIEKKGIERIALESESLLGLVEIDRKVTKELLYKPGSKERFLPYFERERERIKDIAEQIAIHRIAFDAALVYAFIAMKGKAELVEAMDALGLEKERVKACAGILKAQGLIEERKLESGSILLLKRKVKHKKRKRKR